MASTHEAIVRYRPGAVIRYCLLEADIGRSTYRLARAAVEHEAM